MTFIENNIKKILIGILATFFLFICFEIWWIEKKINIKIPQIFVETPYYPAAIVVQPNKEIGPVNQVWSAFAQGGEEPGKEMLGAAVPQIKRLNPDYVRLDHIYDDDYYNVVQGRNSDGTLNLSWGKLDKTVNDILSSGAKPMLVLSYMPSEIAETKTGKPDNWRDWERLVKRTVEHYSRQVDNIYYEVWNEPSLDSFGGWKMSGKKDYRELYLYSVKGAQAAAGVKEFKIGGPSIPEMDPTWIKMLFDYVLKNGIRLDFISWHRYSYNPDVFVQDVYEVNVLTSQEKYSEFAGTEKIITEWGPNSSKDENYSKMVSASHAVNTLRKLLDKVRYAYTFEIKDGVGQGNKGWGLLTHESEGIKEKPRYYIYSWLSDLQGKRVVLTGEGSNVKGFAVKNDRTLTVILSNYSKNVPQTENFSLTFKDLAGGKYRFFEQDLFSQPSERIEDFSDSEWKLDLTMNPYEVKRISLTKISNHKTREKKGFEEILFNEQKDKF